MFRGLKWFQGFGLLCTLAQHAATYRACGRPYTRPNVAAVSGQPFSHADCRPRSSVALLGRRRRHSFCQFYGEPDEDAYAIWRCAFTAPPLILLQPEGQPQDCSSDRRRIVDLAQVLAVARVLVWTPWENLEVVSGGVGGGSEVEARADFGRWPPRLLTMARRLADLWMHTSGPEKVEEPDENTQSAQPSNSPLRQKPVLICTSRRRCPAQRVALSR